MTARQRIVVGMSGASGSIYGIRLLEALQSSAEIETHLVLTDSARETIQLETDMTVEQVQGLAKQVHDVRNLAAPIASGSFVTAGMAVIPCSIRTLSAIANSYDHNLLVRAADVTLKEKRRLVIVPRETPLHLGHLRLMQQAAEIGAIILPPMPAFYHRPKTLMDLIDQTVLRVLDQLGLPQEGSDFRWSGGE